MAKTLAAHIDGDGVMIVRFDHADRPVNTLTTLALDDLDDLIGSLERPDGTACKPVGVIFTSAKPKVFIAGADLFELAEMDRSQMQQYLEKGQGLFDRLTALGIPTVAAINGQCLGGGMELALACTYRVAADIGSINLGLPETKLGLIPAWGGTTRLTRMIGPTRALAPMLAGKAMPPRKALKAGFIDEVVRPELLLDAARRLIKQHPAPRRPGRIDRLVLSMSPLMALVCRSARRHTRARTFGNYPAPGKLIDTVGVAARRGHDAGLRAERESVTELAAGNVCRNLMRLFFLRHDAKRLLERLDSGNSPTPVHQAGVIGGGIMGAGITHALVRAGIPVRLVEVSADAASAALRRVRRLLDDDTKAGTLSPLEAGRAMRRVCPTTHWGVHCGLMAADIVIEAVAERIEVKREVFGQLDRLMRSDAVLASNTSSLSIVDIAGATADPRRVIGLHFFNPVHRMPLVEVVRTAQCDDRALAIGAALALRLGKVPILVGDGPGFAVNRVLIPYLAEALLMASEGVPIDRVDRAMKQWGMPMGPFELLDQIGLDIAVDIFGSVGGRLGKHLEMPAGLDRVMERGWLGRKSDRGFYEYRGKGIRRRKPAINRELIELLSQGDRACEIEVTDISWRLVLPMVNEAARLLGEGVMDATGMVDLATVLGLGLAPFRGGLIHFAESVGLDAIVNRMEQLAVRYPGGAARFTPIAELRRIAETNEPMQALVVASRPGVSISGRIPHVPDQVRIGHAP